MSGPHETVNRHSGMVCCACSCFIYFTKRISSRTLIRFLAYRAVIPCLSLWERWPSEARTEWVYADGCKTLSVTCGDNSSRGRAKGGLRRCTGGYRRTYSRRGSQGGAPRSIVYWQEKWSISAAIRSTLCFMTTHQTPAGVFPFRCLAPAGLRQGLPCDRMGLCQISGSVRGNTWRSSYSIRRKGAASR